MRRPYEGGPSAVATHTSALGRRGDPSRMQKGKAKIDRYSGAPAGGRWSSTRQKRERGDRAKSRSRPSPDTLKGKNPGSHPRSGCAKNTVASKDFCRGRNPGTAACQVGPSHSAMETVARGNGKWVHPGGDAPDTRPEQDSEGKTP